MPICTEIVLMLRHALLNISKIYHKKTKTKVRFQLKEDARQREAQQTEWHV